MLDLALIPAATPSQPPGGPPAASEADAGGGGFADLLDNRLAQPAAVVPATDGATPGDDDAADASKLRADDTDQAGHAVAGIWLAQDWVQRLGHPPRPEQAAGASEMPARGAAGVDRARSRGPAPAPVPDGPEDHRAGPEAMPERTKTGVLAEAATTPTADLDPIAAATEPRAPTEPPTDTTAPTRIGDAPIAALAGTPGVGTAGPRAVGGPPAVSIATPTSDAQFSSALATQVSVLVRDGVQEAQLHLHPADMGPVAVQIAVDGSRAHVHFVAAVDSTCQLLEDSLAQLDAALHEAGLSLAGGSVSHQSADPGRERAASQGQARGGTMAIGADDTAPPGTRPPRPRGMVDLVA